MLSALSIRDIVLIDKLDLEFGAGLCVLTGETGAGKSILLDAFTLAIGGRGDASLVRRGASQGQVTASFELAPDHPVLRLLADNGLEADGLLILRRLQSADGRTRAFINDVAVGVQLLREVGQALVEIHGQHDDRALSDPSGHRDLVLIFITRQADLAARVPALASAIAPNGMVWVAWPKRVSKIETDMTEDVIREIVLPSSDLVDVKVCAIDHVWSGLKLVIRKERR